MQIQINWLLQKPTDLDLQFAKAGYIRVQQDRVIEFSNEEIYFYLETMGKILCGQDIDTLFPSFLKKGANFSLL